MDFDIPEGTQDQFLFFGGSIDYTAPYGTVTSATSVLDRRTRDYEDVSEFTSFGYGTPLLPSPLAAFTNSHDFIQELRFTSAWRAPLQFTAGLYDEQDHASTAFNQYIEGFQAYYGTPMVADLWNPTRTSQQAIYGELTYQITPQWSVTLGERYSHDSYHAGGKLWGAIEFPAGLTYASSTESLASSESDRVLTPRYVLKYQPNANLDLYADAAKGFRPGAGQSAPGPNLCAADYAAAGLTPQELSQYGPDWVWDYELGEKAYFANRRYSLDSSVFWIDWSNIREFLLFTCGEGAEINAGQARSRGVEVQASAVPLKGLSLSGGLGYDDARVVKPGALISVPPAGSMIQEVAPLTASFTAQYEHAWGPRMHWRLHFDYSYTAHRYSVANSPLYPRLVPAYALENVRLSLTRDATDYALFVTNLGGIHPNLSDEMSQAAEAPGRPRWTEGPPTTYGIEARWSFSGSE
jgi:outer membrane receptor protein involved in Fe transport